MITKYLIFALVLCIMIPSAFASDDGKLGKLYTLTGHSQSSQFNSLVQLDSNTYVLAHKGVNGHGYITTFTIPADGSTIQKVKTIKHDAIRSDFNSLVRVDSNTFALAYTGNANNGFISTFDISADGSTIQKVKTVTHTSYAEHNSLIQVDHDTFALAYAGKENGSNTGYITTFTIPADGSTINKVKTEKHGLLGEYNSLVKVAPNTFALAYTGNANNGIITTFTIPADGSTINKVKTVEHNAYATFNSLIQVDHDTFALAYSGVGNDSGYIETFDIPTDGSTIKTLKYLKHDTVSATDNSLINVDHNTFALAYAGNAQNGYISTFDISPSIGSIQKVETLKHSTLGYYNSLIQVDHDTFALAYASSNWNGIISTFSISADGKTSYPVNTKPLIDTITDVTINEDASLSTIALTGISDGGEGNQNLTVTATSDNIALIPDPTVTYNTPDNTGLLSYTPVDDANGVAIITVTVTDDNFGTSGGIESISETFTITVTSVNDVPVAATQSIIAEENTAKTITLTGSDADGDSLTFTITNQPSHGTLTGTAPYVTYTPNFKYYGSDEFTFTVNDKNGGTNTATVYIRVTPDKNPPPTDINRNITYFEPNITYNKDDIPWQATIHCKLIVEIPDTLEARMTIYDPHPAGVPSYYTDGTNLSFDLPSLNDENIVGTCKIKKKGEAEKFEPFNLSIGDADGDGVYNTFDQCPTKHGTLPNGCNVNPPDTDGDGVIDTNDTCPTEAGTLPNGCPVIPPTIEPDKLNRNITYFHPNIKYNQATIPWQATLSCNNIVQIPAPWGPEMVISGSQNGGGPYLTDGNNLTFILPSVNYDQFKGACKVVKITGDATPKYEPFTLLIEDYDEDGVVNIVDLCPSLREDRIGTQIEDGCPDGTDREEAVPDTDGDRINDNNDECPTIFGRYQPNGCPLNYQFDTDGQSTKKQKKGNGGCSDCTPPTLGLDKTYKRIVDDGFSYNGNMVQVEKWHTEFPLINATVGVPNLVEIKVYENTGITNMKWVQFCLGAEERGQPLNSCEVLIEVHLSTNGTTTGIMVDNIVINDKDNLIDNDTVTAVSYVIPCMEDSTKPNCVKVDLEYTYREETFNHMLIVNVLDKARNSQNFHFNEGVNVLGESLNDSPTITLFDKHTSQQKDNLHITYTRIDKITDTWVDQYGIEYHRINDNSFDRITPADSYECTDPTLDKVKVWKRTNCHFRDLTDLWSYN